jgi:energy-coupling factor transport system substrate-specific component
MPPYAPDHASDEEPTVTTTPATIDGLPASEALGVGLRFSLHPMTDRFVDVILGALDDVDDTGVAVTVTDVSTHVAGAEADLARYVRDATLAALERLGDGHLAVNLLLSRGCPGAVRCDPGGLETLPVVATVELEPADVRATAHWALYPLGEAASGEGDGNHMAAIERGIAATERDGTFVRVERFVTRLEGDLSAVLGSVIDAWAAAGAVVPHVTSHVFLSIGSPSDQGETSG